MLQLLAPSVAGEGKRQHTDEYDTWTWRTLHSRPWSFSRIALHELCTVANVRTIPGVVRLEADQ